MKLFNWIWKRSKEAVLHDVLNEIHNRRQYHQLMAENAYLRERYFTHKSETMPPLMSNKYSTQEHGVAHEILSYLWSDIAKMLEENNQL